MVKIREVEKKKAVAERKIDDPLAPKRLGDAITIVGVWICVLDLNGTDVNARTIYSNGTWYYFTAAKKTPPI